LVFEPPDLGLSHREEMQPKTSAGALKEEALRIKVGELLLWSIQSGAEPGVPDVPP